MNSELKELISPEEIEKLVLRLSSEIREDYTDKNPLMVGLLKGSFIFMADLVRKIGIPLETEFLRASSYGRKIIPSPEVELAGGLAEEVHAREVILVEDIADNGRTLKRATEHILELGATSVTTCALLARNSCPLKIDYLGRKVGEGFIVGYGLDYEEGYRHLEGLYVVEERKCDG